MASFTIWHPLPCGIGLTPAHASAHATLSPASDASGVARLRPHARRNTNNCPHAERGCICYR